MNERGITPKSEIVQEDSESFHVPQNDSKPTDLERSQTEEQRHQEEFNRQRGLTSERVRLNPPSFYETGIPKEITSVELATEIAKLGMDYNAPTLIIEWNRTDGHEFFLSTMLPLRTGGSGHVYSKVSLGIAKHLVNGLGILTELGHTQGDEDLASDAFTTPLLEQNQEEHRH